MRKALFVLFLVLLITSAIVSYSFTVSHVYPHLYLNRRDVSWQSEKEVQAALEKSYGKPFAVKIRDRIYPFTYRQLGILLDKKATARLIFESNTRPFPQNVLAFIDALRSQKLVLPSLVFTQDYSGFIDKAVFDFTTEKDRYSVDNESKTVLFTDNEVKYRIDGQDLQSQLAYSFGDGIATYEPKLIPVMDGKKEASVAEQNRALNQIFAAPLSVVIQDRGLTSVSFSPADLKKMFAIRWEAGGVEYVPQETAIAYLIDGKIDPLVSRSRSIDKAKIREDIVSSFMARTKGEKSSPVLVKTSEKIPTTTHGEIAERYIEVDIAQQKMYLFYRGEMVKSYTVSTGLYYPTPTGHFHIMNKAEEGYSDIFNVYMPWWMAFYYGWAGGQDAYFGIHELPYWYVGSERKQRPREFLGAPHTGGCVSLDIGAARDVYDFSYVGMDVVIYP